MPIYLERFILSASAAAWSGWGADLIKLLEANVSTQGHTRPDIFRWRTGKGDTVRSLAVFSRQTSMRRGHDQHNDCSSEDTDRVCLFVCHIGNNEVGNVDYGMFTWPCAPVLSQYLWSNRRQLQSMHILEIGCGTALCGIVAAKCGAQVVVSDSPLFSDCLDNCCGNLQANGLHDVHTIPLTWGLITPAVLDLPAFDIILGSDCFYNTKYFEDILVTVAFLLKQKLNSQFWCTYQNRSSSRTIEFYLSKWSLKAKEVPMKSFLPNNVDWRCAGTDSVHMFIITLDMPHNSTNI